MEYTDNETTQAAETGGRRPVAKKIAGSVLTFLILQLVVGGVIGVLSKILPNNILTSNSILIVANYIVGPLSILISWKLLKVIELKKTFRKGSTFINSNRYSIAAGLLGTVACMMFANILTELIGAPDELENQFEDIMRNIFGLAYISVFGPLVEELIFREGIVGFMQRNGKDARLSIAVSAILFGLMHVNPAQVVVATILGVALGVLYWKTRNIWLCGIVHILNNSTVTIENLTLPKEIRDMSFADMIGSQPLAIVCMLAFGLLSWLLISYFWKTYRDCL